MKDDSLNYSVLGSEETNTSSDRYKFKVKITNNNVDNNGAMAIRLLSVKRTDRYIQWTELDVAGRNDDDIFGQTFPHPDSIWIAEPETDDCSGYRLKHVTSNMYLHGTEGDVVETNRMEVEVKTKKTNNSRVKQIWEFQSVL